MALKSQKRTIMMAYGLSLSLITRQNGIRRLTSVLLTEDSRSQRCDVRDVLMAKSTSVGTLFDLLESSEGGVEISPVEIANIKFANGISFANGVEIPNSVFANLKVAADQISDHLSAGIAVEAFIDHC